MPNDERRSGRTGDEDPERAHDDLSGALEQLDRAAARVRQLIYRVRPLLRGDNASAQEEDRHEDRRPVRGQFRRRDG